MSIKANLKVILKASDVLVAESTDPILWQNVLLAINSGVPDLSSVDNQLETRASTSSNSAGVRQACSDHLAQFAAQLALDQAQVFEACEPKSEKPFLHLDLHCWEEMKKQLPKSGSASVPLLALPATLLVLWMSRAGLGTATQAQAQAVLDTINTRDRNASRSLRNTSWLKGRPGGQIVVNPAEISRALKVARCFCSKDWSTWKA